MLFNSYVFILAFLPASLIGYFVIGKVGHHRAAIAWLFAASLFFYGWWNPSYLWLIVGSILFNYTVGIFLATREAKNRRVFLAVGIAANLAALGYYKYANFFVENLNAVAATDFNLHKVVLPLAISFFTFQQITYLVDAYRRETHEYSFLHYCLFVTFFPQLIAGPIVHHREMLPQFASDEVYRPQWTNISVGSTIFFIGLFKKVVLADSAAVYASPVFAAAEGHEVLTLAEAWGGALAYTFQLYFDFSGYSDMAIGAARMFGIRLPINFFEPYRATSIIEFWRRWHMTLSRFLKDYVYIPLGGNRKGRFRRHANLMVTMILGGLWHGAGWTFVIWGALHGVYLVIAHVWRTFAAPVIGLPLFRSASLRMIGAGAGWALTFLCVVVAWVFFRAETLDGAIVVLSGMVGANGLYVPVSYAPHLGAGAGVVTLLGGHFVDGQSVYLDQFVGFRQIALLALSFVIVLTLPTTTRLLAYYDPVIDPAKGEVWESRIKWRPNAVWAIIVGVIAFAALVMAQQPSEFLYFQF